LYLREAGSQKAVTPAELIASRFIPDGCPRYEIGDQNWMSELPDEKTGSEVAISRTIPQGTWKGVGKRHRFFPTKKPSHREGTITHRRSTEAEARGRLVHHIIEQIDWLSREVVNSQYLDELHAVCSVAHPGISHDAISDVLSLLRADPVAGCFDKSRYECRPTALRLYRELPFSFIEQAKNGTQHIVTGVIDRIVVVEDTWIELIEFKTGYLTHKLDDLHSHFRGQMTLYMKALSRLFPHIRRVRPTFCFLDRGELVSSEMSGNSSPS
jgi:hypothetical protein